MEFRVLHATVVLVAALTLSGCGDDPVPPAGTSTGGTAPVSSRAGTAPATGVKAPARAVARWYSAEQVERGGVIYARDCAGCHGSEGQGTVSWRQRNADGSFPPPPLNGTAHAWHHPLRILGSQIKFGAPGGQGKMPAFGESLSDQQILDVIAWVQSRWSDEIFAQWLEIEARSRSSSQ